MRRADARRRERDRPEGVTQGFQVILYKVDPSIDVLACNLFSKDCCRARLADKVLERWPQVPLVIKPSSFACRAGRLARATTCPDWSRVVPSCATKSIGPNSNASEKVALRVADEFVWTNIFDRSFINNSRRNVPCLNQVAQPSGRVWVNFVVEGVHRPCP